MFDINQNSKNNQRFIDKYIYEYYNKNIVVAAETPQKRNIKEKEAVLMISKAYGYCKLASESV